MKARYSVSVTFDVLTPESAANGDFEETGFEVEPARGTLRDAIEAVEDHAYHCENFQVETLHHSPQSQSLYGTDPVTDYRTGAETRYAVHVSADRRFKRHARAMHWFGFAVTMRTRAGKLSVCEVRRADRRVGGSK